MIPPCRRGALALLAFAACTAPVSAEARPAVATEVAAAADLAAFDPARRYPSGSRIVLLDLARPDAAPRSISEGLDAAGAPSVRADGRRIAFVGRESATGRFRLWTCAADGSGRVRSDEGAADCGSAAFLADGRLVWSAAAPDASWALFVSGDGVAPRRITFSGGIDVRPSVLPDGRVAFASRAPGADGFVSLSVHPDGTGVAPLADEEPGAAAVAGGRFVEVAALAPRPSPQGHLSVVDPAKTTGDVFCVDARPPGGGHARRVRIVTLERSSRPLGDVPLEEDGSFFVRVPADTPLGLDVLDDDGRVVATQRTPFWVRPGETRGCVGCHESPDTTPPNVRPAAVLCDPTPLGLRRASGGVR